MVQSPNPQRRSTSPTETGDTSPPEDRSPEVDRLESISTPSAPARSQRYRRRNCPKRTPLNRPKRISTKAKNGGRCDYLDPDGKHCSHWQAPGSDACYCHFDAYMERFPFDMPYPRTKQSRSGGWKKKKPVIAVMMVPNELTQRGWYDAP